MVRLAAKRSKDGPQARRLLALAAIYEDASRTEAAKIGGVTLQISRDWVLKFNAHGPDGLVDRKPPWQAPRLNDIVGRFVGMRLPRRAVPLIEGLLDQQLDLINRLRPVTPD
jgi:transposase